MRREQPRERRHEIHPAIVGDRRRQRLDLSRRADDPELIAQPLHRRAGDRDRPFERVDRVRTADAIADRRQEARLGRHDLAARVQQHEIAGAVRILGLARPHAHLADGGGLLIAQITTQRHFPAERTAAAGTTVKRRIRRRADRRQHAPRDPEHLQQFVVPCEGLQIHQHRPARVGDVRDVRPAVWTAGEVPDHPRVDIAEHRLPALRGVANAIDVLENPLNLGPGEIRGRRQARARPDQRRRGRIDPRHQTIRPRVLPHDRVVPGSAGLRIPDHRRLTLIGDANRRQIRRGQAAGVQRAGDRLVGAGGNLQRVVLDPARTRQDLIVLHLMAGHFLSLAVEHHETRARRSLIERADISHG